MEDAVRNAGRFDKEAGMDAVKLEGGRQMVPQIRAISEAGMLVMAHVGLTPQSAAQMGGFRVQCNTAEGAMKVLGDARLEHWLRRQYPTPRLRTEVPDALPVQQWQNKRPSWDDANLRILTQSLQGNRNSLIQVVNGLQPHAANQSVIKLGPQHHLVT